MDVRSVAFTVDSIEGVEFVATREDVSTKAFDAGWVHIVGRRSDGTEVVDDGFQGPTSVEDSIPNAPPYQPVDTRPAVFAFPELPGVTFMVEPEIEFADEGDIRITAVRDQDRCALALTRIRLVDSVAENDVPSSEGEASGHFAWPSDGDATGEAPTSEESSSGFSTASPTPAPEYVLEPLSIPALPSDDSALWGAWAHTSEGTLLATGGSQGRVRIWNARTREIRWLEGHRGAVRCGGWGEIDGQPALATGGDDGTVKVWRIENDSAATLPRIGGSVTWIAWGTVDGARHVAAGGEGDGADRVWIWDVVTRVSRSSFDLPDGCQLLWGAWSFALPTTDPLLALGGSHGYLAVNYPRTDRMITIQHARDDYTVLWGLVDTEITDHSLIMGGCSDGAVRVWTSGELIATLAGHEGPVVWGQRCRVDGERLVTGERDGTVCVWDVGSPYGVTGGRLAPTTRWRAHERDMTWGAIARVGSDKLLATGGDSGVVRVWRVADGSLVEEIRPRHAATTLWGGWAGAPDSAAGPVATTTGLPLLADGGAHSAIGMWEIVRANPIGRHPLYQSDGIGSADSLRRRTEATALADLITSSSVTPPLAVGVFGEWGEGKSHFLDLMRQEVQARALTTSTACSHVRQVRFNAWHYAETELWASLVAEIFAQLARPEKDNEPGEAAERQRQQSRLLAEVVSERRLPERIAAERQRQDELARALRERPRFKQLTDRQRNQVSDAVDVVDPNLERAITRHFFGALSWPRYLWSCARALVGQLPRWVRALVPIIVLIVIALCVPAVQSWLKSVLASAAVLGLLAVFAQVWTVARDTSSNVRRVWDTLKSSGDQLQRLTESWSAKTETALEVSTASLAQLEGELRDLTAAGRLAGLVSERAGGGGYRQSLGVMTQIRDDFESMSRLLREGRDENPEYLAQVAALYDERDPLPQIDRIVLYIDDLDRCPPTLVVEVLEAIHLLLAVELFVVVVAVDPRWLMRAISVHYRELLQLSSPPAGEPEPVIAGSRPGSSSERWAFTPSQYLEKIFQVVFTLPQLSPAGHQDLLETLVGRRTDEPSPEPPGVGVPDTSPPAPVPRTPTVPETASYVADEVPEQLDERVGDILDDLEFVTRYGTPRAEVRIPVPRITDRVDPLALSADELALMNLLGPPLIRTPRSVKRLANSYGILAAIRNIRAGTDDSLPESSLPGMVLLAILIGYPNLGTCLVADLAQQGDAGTWTGLINRKSVRSRCIDVPPGESWESLRPFLLELDSHAADEGIPVPTSCRDWRPWIVPAARLAFPAGSVLGRLGLLTEPNAGSDPRPNAFSQA
ncbi:P-loop NTPase fold protein [Gordonia rhizosphera]|uniref:KAP NTPase domain-containing protein n=1 Tax=Gordonia rhizosphera NBRC 16068 TaxID=1108045 RepID=K6W867_9ACTN|nr:P-loop NTPase fold protein [Gordonia rhizosphera]GAB89936.1 hypothetical protein GORHZ_076_00120 [Gordonia rhizosphera NBRC 16068]